MSGFVTLHRKALEHPLFAADSARLGAWFWLVAKACWKPTKFDINGKIVTLKRGQFCGSVRDLAAAWGWSKSSVDRFLTRLKTETMIETDAGTGRLIITICNYEKYQDQSTHTGTPSGTPTGTAAGQQWDIKEQGNKGTIEEEPSGSSSPPTPHRDPDWPELPDWIPAEAWNGWLDIRRRKSDWPTARAIKIAIDKLSDWKSKGHDPGDVLDNSTLNRWTGLFEPKEKHNGNRNHQPPRDNRDGFTRALDRELGLDDPAGPSGRRDAGDGRSGGQGSAGAAPALL